MQRLKLSEYYKTSELPLIAILSLSFPIEAVDKANPSKVEFYFKRNSELEKLVESYWRRVLQVEPQAFFNQIKGIKSRIYENR